MIYAAIGRFADEKIDVTEILPILERLMFRLTSDNRSAAIAARTARTQTDDRADGG
ncbi:hypothetical protein MXD62_24445 [Frankia sp. Mgl5]|uniref:hypothetical protein n=1 Tax=Frankia sp. Mgl5 TaxID=2933793 RepID=UPI00200FE05A|nr:hypothetical protein [Frankia sp. Mgl5]MCK9930275.1 hypothetical protein [Frankia sp. Mgl5]